MKMISRKISVFCTALAMCLWAFIQQGCSFYNKPLLEELKEYTENVHMMRSEISAPTEPDSDGIPCITSESAVTLTYYLSNPQMYTFDHIKVTAADGSEYTGVQNPSSIGIVSVVLPRALLVSIDGNEAGALNPSLTIKEPRTGREFGPFVLPLRCNTPPPAVQNMTVLCNSDDNTYVLAWNMPNMSENVIHDDISSLSISMDGNPILAVPVNPDGTESYRGLDETAGFNFDGSDKYVALPGSNAFAGAAMTRAVYYPTTKTVVDNQQTVFELTLSDEKGFKSSVTVSNLSTYTDEPVISEADTQAADGSLPVTVTATDPDSYVYWRIIYSGTNVTAGSFVSGGKSVAVRIPPLPVGKTAVVEAYARKNGELDSGSVKSREITSSDFTFVYAGGVNSVSLGVEEYPGTSDVPFEIDDALSSEFAAKASGKFTVRLAADDSAPETDMVLNNAFIIDGGSWDSRARTLQRKSIAVTSGGGTFSSLAVNAETLTIATGTALTLKDSAVTGNITASSGISLSDSSINGTVTLNDDTVITVLKEFSANVQTPAATINCDNLPSGTVVLHGTDDFTLTENTLSRFLLTKTSWYIALEKDSTGAAVGVVRAPGISVTIPFATFTAKATLGTDGSNPCVQVDLYDADSNKIEVSDLKLTIQLEGTVVKEGAVFDTTLKEGSYIVWMEFSVDGVGYNGRIPVKYDPVTNKLEIEVAQ